MKTVFLFGILVSSALCTPLNLGGLLSGGLSGSVGLTGLLTGNAGHGAEEAGSRVSDAAPSITHEDTDIEEDVELDNPQTKNPSRGNIEVPYEEDLDEEEPAISGIKEKVSKPNPNDVNAELGKVDENDVESSSPDISNPTTESPSELDLTTTTDSTPPAPNLSLLKDELYTNVIEGNYDIAVDITKKMDSANGSEDIKEVVMKLIRAGSPNVMAYCYKVFNSEGDEIIRKSFPDVILSILKEELVTILSNKFKQALKLDANVDSYNDRLAWGDKSDKTSKRVIWKFIPIWENDNVVFKMYNPDCDMYLKLDVRTDKYGDRQAWGSTNDNEDRHKYYVEPLMKDETLIFRIINSKYNQPLKLDSNVDSYGDRKLWGHKGDPRGKYTALDWVITAKA